ncbi:CDP-diacylglycerol--serine O-phosphatidyltransferase [Bacteroides sp. 224]|uniref:CDP-diacylglycerol--serine O-phosphatidyltransferase n=1 Tax=Bacteroides sp. 224 TaxID=2302936 RepID=UPI0013D0DAF3|nr:CDP-diacylglycerol--serine O-phosphatidyltransferase [Bacteroides sp. 224]NDV66471.1 CDP-diacylglycerol--serine O-phosphatidyltransferase [Bacteroides sp. 224]
MANTITRYIPNTITCLNLFSGCIACVMAFEANYSLAFLFIIFSGIFDFLDGMLARVLNAPSAIGKELDSLADDISFGAAPAFIIFSLFKEVHYPAFMEGISAYVPYFAFVIAVFSALRLAKFNIDERQTESFVGLNTPSNAFFWSSLVVGNHAFLTSTQFNAIYLIILVIIFSLLLVSEIPMFAFKFKSFTWQENKIRVLFLVVAILLIVFLGISGIAASMVWYIILSLITNKKK